ncbi:MAG: hypothetical protein ACOCQE_00895 [Halanaerobium sp.]
MIKAYELELMKMPETAVMMTSSIKSIKDVFKEYAEIELTTAEAEDFNDVIQNTEFADLLFKALCP